jgi:hypothetical protein
MQARKLCSFVNIFLFSLMIIISVNAHAEYYLIYDTPSSCCSTRYYHKVRHYRVVHHRPHVKHVARHRFLHSHRRYCYSCCHSRPSNVYWRQPGFDGETYYYQDTGSYNYYQDNSDDYYQNEGTSYSNDHPANVLRSYSTCNNGCQ